MALLTHPLSRPTPKTFDHISYSAISTFQTCPLRFYFRYVLGLPVTTVSSSLVFGSAMHRAVQFHFEQLMMGQPAPDIDALLNVYREYWESCSQETMLFGADESLDNLGRMADRMLRAFLTSDFAKPTGTLLGIEEEPREAIIPGCPDLLARVDLIVDGGDELQVIDFKTARCSWNEHKVDDIAPQLVLYSELVKPIADGRPVKLKFVVLTKTKLPTLTMHDVPLDRKRVERTKKTVEHIWTAIQSGHFYPNPAIADRRATAQYSRTGRPATTGKTEYGGGCWAWYDSGTATALELNLLKSDWCMLIRGKIDPNSTPIREAAKNETTRILSGLLEPVNSKLKVVVHP